MTSPDGMEGLDAYLTSSSGYDDYTGSLHQEKRKKEWGPTSSDDPQADGDGYDD